MFSSTANKNIAFLIEGCNLIEKEYPNKKYIYVPERSAITLARLNDYQVFDPIVGGIIISEQVFMELFGSANEFKQKILVSFFIKQSRNGTFTHQSKCSVGMTNERIIFDLKKILQKCLDKGVIKALPKWAIDLTALNLNNFEIDVLDEMKITFGSNEDKFCEMMHQEIIFISNKFSFINLLKFLEENPLINVIYGMIGSAHLAIVDQFNRIIKREIDELGGGYVNAELNIGNRIIEFHLLGGVHEHRADYKKLLKCVKNIPNIIIPINNNRINLNNFLNVHFSFFVRQSPITYLQDQRLLRTARRLLDRDYPQVDAEIDPDIAEYRCKILTFLSNLKTKPLSAEDRSSLQEFINLLNYNVDFNNEHSTKNSVF